MKKIYKVRALVLDHDGSTLAIEADHPRVLQLPGGSRKPKEDPIKTLHREMREETGHKIGSIRHVRRLKVNRNGCREITDFYVVRIKGGRKKAKLTGREASRGLRVCRYESPHTLRSALQDRVQAYGRSAARRDLRLVSLTV
jgi:8-oxo-dGTP pyrophosphatase MutT (NUDIX family)